MPSRSIPLTTGQYYHVFNRGINKQPIFLDTRDYRRALQVLKYYCYEQRLRYSKFMLLSRERREDLWKSAKKENKKTVNIISFCFMPNHFHLLLEQTRDNGISEFVSNFQNSYTKYFNTKRDGIGPLLQGQFKAVRVEDENQLLHLNRYIHLNPYTSFVVKKLDELLIYPWSSFGQYNGDAEDRFCETNVILSQFPDTKNYQQFVFDQADYQRELDQIKHLRLED